MNSSSSSSSRGSFQQPMPTGTGSFYLQQDLRLQDSGWVLQVAQRLSVHAQAPLWNVGDANSNTVGHSAVATAAGYVNTAATAVAATAVEKCMPASTGSRQLLQDVGPYHTMLGIAGGATLTVNAQALRQLQCWWRGGDTSNNSAGHGKATTAPGSCCCCEHHQQLRSDSSSVNSACPLAPVLLQLLQDVWRPNRWFGVSWSGPTAVVVLACARASVVGGVTVT